MPTLCSLNLFNWSDFIPNFTICSQLGRRILLFVSESIWAELGVAGRGDRTGPLLHTDFVTTNYTWSPEVTRTLIIQSYVERLLNITDDVV